MSSPTSSEGPQLVRIVVLYVQTFGGPYLGPHLMLIEYEIIV